LERVFLGLCPNLVIRQSALQAFS